VFATIGATTVVITVMAIRHPAYHGVLWRWFNPTLPQWWRGRGDTEQRSAP